MSDHERSNGDNDGLGLSHHVSLGPQPIGDQELHRALGRIEAYMADTRRDIRDLKTCVYRNHTDLDKRVAILEAFRMRMWGALAALALPFGAAGGWITNLLAGITDKH